MNANLKHIYFQKVFIGIVSFLSIFCISAPILLNASENPAEIFKLINEKLISSNIKVEEFNNNEKVLENTKEIILKIHPSDVGDPETVKNAVFALLKLGNTVLIKEEPCCSIKFYQHARLFCGDRDNQLLFRTPEEIVNTLGTIHPQLPALYASVLYNLTRATWYQNDLPLQRQKAKLLCRTAIGIVDAIDKLHFPQFPTEQRYREVTSSNLYRMFLVRMLTEEGSLTEAETELEQIPQNTHWFIDFTIAQHYFRLKFAQAKETINPQFALQYFTESKNWIDQILYQISKEKDTIARQGSPFVDIGDFYVEPQNPYHNIQLAEQFYKRAKEYCPESYAHLHYRINIGLSNIEQIKAKAHLHRYHERDSQLAITTNEIDDDVHALCFERLGNMMRSKHKHFEAIVYYCHAYRLEMLAGRSVEHLENNIQSTEEAILDKYGFNHRERSRIVERMLKYRHQISLQRIKAKEVLSSSSPLKAAKYVSDYYVKLLRRLFADITEELTLPKVPFQLVAYGSVARGMATPYSDIECAILVDCSLESEQYGKFLGVAELLGVYLSFLGETSASSITKTAILPSLLVPDGTSLDWSLIKKHHHFTKVPVINVTEKAEFINSEGFYSMINSLTSATSICGDATLLANFIESTTSQNYLPLDLILYSPFKKYETEKGPTYSLKHDVYQPLVTYLEGICIKLGIREHNPTRQVEALANAKVISNCFAKELHDLIKEICSLRFEQYELHSSQKEQISEIPPFIQKTLIKLFLIATEIENLKIKPEKCDEGMNAYLKKIQIGWDQLSECHFDQAMASFSLAQDYFQEIFPRKNKFLADAFMGIGITHFQQGNNAESVKYLDKAVAIYQLIYGPYHRKNMIPLSHLIKVVRASGDSKRAQELVEYQKRILPQKF